MANADDLLNYQDAKRARNQIHSELMDVNPSELAASKKDLMETHTVHRIGVPTELRRVLRTTNPIESAFSRVETYLSKRETVSSWQSARTLDWFCAHF